MREVRARHSGCVALAMLAAMAAGGMARAQVGKGRAVTASEHVHVKAQPWLEGRVVEVCGSELIDEPAGAAPADSGAAWSGWLSNSVRVHVVPMGGPGGEAALRVVIASEVREGDGSRELMLARASAAMLNDMAASGAHKRAIEAAGWSFSANAWDGAVTINAQGPGDPGSVEQVVRAVASMLDKPMWTPAGLTRWREKAKALIDAGTSDPRTALNTALEELMGVPALDAAVLDAAVFDEAPAVAGWLASRAAGSPMSVALGGGIDRAASMQSMAAWFGGLGAWLGEGAARARMTPAMPEPWEPAEIERTVAVRAAPGAPAMVLRGVVGPSADRLDTARRLRQASQLIEARAAQLLAERGLPTSGLASGMIFGDRHGGRSLAWVLVAVEPERAGAARDALDEALVGIGDLAQSPETIAVLRASTAEEISMLTGSPAYWVDRLTASDVTGLPVISASALREAYTSITGEQIAEAVEAFGGRKHRVSLTVTPGVSRGSGSR